MTIDIPEIALSVRQPSAWAIIHGGKVIENRTLGAIKSGGMERGRIAIHAAIGMKEKEYRYLVWRMQLHGTDCPRPDALIRRAIIGVVDVVDIIDRSDSPWFGGPWGLVLENPVAVDPIPAAGELGYFRWEPSGALAEPAPWMVKFDRANGDAQTLELFPDQAPSFERAPKKPFGAPRKS
ncbi:hypothetical protein [Thalassococcus sp. S3]|uniref:hypothetical protein n=1 Tax=Thalassococcus sp. S3 TaxID=2017482 RepID=UPI00102AEBE2|nr:hypothetical protein [Thalassococcus sp. S3]